MREEPKVGGVDKVEEAVKGWQGKVGVRESPCCADRRCHAASKKGWCFCDPRIVQAQDPHKGEREAFGKVVMVKAKPTRKIVKAVARCCVLCMS